MTNPIRTHIRQLNTMRQSDGGGVCAFPRGIGQPTCPMEWGRWTQPNDLNRMRFCSGCSRYMAYIGPATQAWLNRVRPLAQAPENDGYLGSPIGQPASTDDIELSDFGRARANTCCPDPETDSSG